MPEPVIVADEPLTRWMDYFRVLQPRKHGPVMGSAQHREGQVLHCHKYVIAKT